jgi:hypothetical protein
MKLREFITEAAGPKVGRKYQHIEDLIVSDGSHGGLHAIERLRHMGEEGGNIELKWDGMPVVYWGRDEQGNFGMFPKNAWQYLKSGKTETSSGASTIMRSPDDVKAFVMGTGSGDPKARQQFANQFAGLWPYFEKISPKQGYLEGGLLFYPGNKPDGTSAMPVVNPETNTYDFTPNITTFHIPVDSELGKKIKQSKVMVAATGYFPTMGSSDEQRLPNAESLSVPGVIVQGTTYVQEPVPLDSKGLDAMEAFLKKNAKLIDNYLAPKPGLSNPGGELYTYMNKHLRTEGLLADFPEWANANLSAKKAETLLSDPEGLKATLGAVEGLSNQKNILINQLSQGLHGGIKQTKPEGYVQAHPGKQFNYDMPGQFIKTIDQTNWSPKESVVNEAKSGSNAVVGWGRGMGHTGHDALVQAVIHQAENTGATPYFFVSRSFGKDDPIPPETKLAMYQKKFPKYAKMFSLPPEGMTTLNAVLDNLKTKGYTDATIVVGETEKDAFNYLIKPDSTGNPAYKNFGWNNITVMSRQDTKAPGSDKSKPDYHEGPRATPMRQVLLDPNKTEQEQFAVWRQAMSPSLDDSEVLDMMNTAKQNLIQFHTKKPRRKASKIKEHIAKMRPLLKEASVEQQYKMLKLMKEAYKQTDEDLSRRGFLRGAGALVAGASLAGTAKAADSPDPNRLIAIVNIEGESKQFDLTGKFKGDVKSQLQQADEFLTTFLEKRDINFSNLELRYQGAVLRTQNAGSVREEQGVDEAFSMPSMADIKNKIPTKEGVKNWLLKFKNGLSQEASESKEMMDVYVRYMNGFPVSKEEMNIANQQVKDVVRMLGLGAYALLPGHVITAPVIFGLAKKYNVELFPSAFRNQPVQEKMKMGATIEPIEEDDVIPHMVKDLTGKGAPIAKLRAARDTEQMKKRERSDGLPVEPKFDYLDEK